MRDTGNEVERQLDINVTPSNLFEYKRENTRIAEVEGVSWGLHQADEKFDSLLGKSDYYEVDARENVFFLLTELVTRILLMTFS